MSLFRRLQRWLEDPLRAELEGTRRDLAVTEERLSTEHSARMVLEAKNDILRQNLTDTLRLVAEMKRAGFVSEPVYGQPAQVPAEESQEEQQVWEAIYQRAPRGSQMASFLYAHAQTMLAQDEPIEHVIGTILEGGEIDLDDLEERGA